MMLRADFLRTMLRAWPTLVLLLLAGCADDPGGGPGLSDGAWADGGGGALDGGQADQVTAGASIKIHTIDVGAGLCVVVEMPDPLQPVLLADCGQDVWKASDVSASLTVTRARQIIGKRKVALIISHPHSDHYSLVDNVLDQSGSSLELSTVWLGGSLGDYHADGDRVFKRLSAFRLQQPAKVHDALARSYRSPYPGGEPDLTFGAVKVYVLAVNESVGAPQADTNGKSMVLLIKYGSFTAVLPGDADGEVQQHAVKHAMAMGLPLDQVALLLGAHHGSGTYGSNNKAWATAVQPKIMVYSAGRDANSTELKMHNSHPYYTVVSRFDALPSMISATKHGLFQGNSGGKANKLETQKAHYLSASNGVITVSSTGKNGGTTVTCEAHPGTTRDTRCGLK